MVKKPQDFHQRALPPGGRAYLPPPLVLGEAMGMAALCGAAGNRHLGHRGDCRERLSTKPVALYLFEVLKAANLACGVARNGQGQVLGSNAKAIVTDTDAATAPVFQRYRNLLGQGI
nr:hypothetical protein NCPCFENI_00428 [Cupriavidus sp.]